MCYLNDYDPSVLPKNHTDFSHKHNETYVLLNGKVELIRGVVDEDTWAIGKQKVAKLEGVKRIDRQYKLFNFGNEMYIAQFNPERKYKTGFCSSNMRFFKFPNIGQDLNNASVEAYVQQNYVTFEEAINTVDRQSVAFSEQWGIAHIADNHGNNMVVLCYYNTPVANIKGKKVSIQNELYSEEIRDLFADKDYFVS